MIEEKLLSDLEKAQASINLLAQTTELSFLAEAKLKQKDC